MDHSEQMDPREARMVEEAARAEDVPGTAEYRARRRAEFTAGLRALADVYDEHPEVPVKGQDFSAEVIETLYVPVDDGDGREAGIPALARDILADCARAIPGRVEKAINDEFLTIVARFGPIEIHFYASKGDTCEAKIVGTKIVEKPVMKTEQVGVERVEEDVIEWDCGPLLAGVSTRREND